MGQDSIIMRAPAEVRLVIYQHLFNDSGNHWLLIQTAESGKITKSDQSLRTRYYALERNFHRRCYETTYQLGTQNVSFCAALMRANRQIHQETSYLVYGKHSFDFGNNIEAIEPFLTDLTPASRDLVREISLYKRGPVPMLEHDKSEWRGMCRFLERNTLNVPLKKLRLVVEGGRPNVQDWDGPKEFSASDFKFLADIKHESLEWALELAQVRGIEELEILGDVKYCPPPASPNMIIFAAFSASIDKGLAEFLRARLRVGA